MQQKNATMGRVGAFAGCVIAMALHAVSTGASEETLAVGSIDSIDLAHFRRIIDESDDVGAPVPTLRHDLSLRESVEIALRHNLSVQIARLELDVLVPEVEAQRAKFHPVPGASGSASAQTIQSDNLLNNDREKDSQDAAVFVRQALPTGGSLELQAGYSRSFDNGVTDNLGLPLATTDEIAGFGISLAQPLLRGARTYVATAGIEDAKFDRSAADARLNAQILQITAQTKSAYYDTILAQRLIEIIDNAIVRDHELIGYSRALFDAGEVSQRDVISAEINLTTDTAQRTTRLAEREVAQNALRDVLGLPIDQQVDIVDKTIPFRPVEIKLDQWIKSAYENRPEFLEIQSELGRASLRIKLARNFILPKFDAFGSYQQDVNFESNRWSVGAQFEIPFGNVAARSRLTSAKVEHDRLERFYVQQQRTIEIEVRQLEIRLRENVLRLGDLATGVEQARAKREIAQGRFKHGLANNFDITDADRDLVAAESQLLRAVVDYASSLAFLEASIGAPI